MNLLLDTHIFIWWMESSRRLPEKIQKAINNPQNDIFISSVVAWEISIKKKLGRLTIPDDIEEAIKTHHFIALPITIAHAVHTVTLPLHHKDPFDRMFVSQARVEKLTLVSTDNKLKKYDVRLFSG